ncbi:hypothetical protein Bca52824_074015 [Brassica carinata]|uniref:CMP/dCMP-type deaminase domain-containing protein n=1 Tax=Brassica carinata TaxID=52824 RepID=A0A8X7QB02_BRACI|nr:hypothetical protein Bca52824_074015 [Brassica carinata]
MASVAVFDSLGLQAKLALEALEVPVGCVILEEGNIIASGRNRTNETSNSFFIILFRERPQDMQRWKQSMNLLDNGKKIDFDLYVTCEPCIMCASTLSFLGIKEVYYACGNDKFGVVVLYSQRGKGYKCRGIMADEAVSLFKSPKPHRPVVQRERT